MMQEKEKDPKSTKKCFGKFNIYSVTMRGRKQCFSCLLLERCRKCKVVSKKALYDENQKKLF